MTTQVRNEAAETRPAIDSTGRDCGVCGWPTWEGRHANPCRDGLPPGPAGCGNPEAHHAFIPKDEFEAIRAAERRATVERIRQRVVADGGFHYEFGGINVYGADQIQAILDEEAAR